MFGPTPGLVRGRPIGRERGVEGENREPRGGFSTRSSEEIAAKPKPMAHTSDVAMTAVRPPGRLRSLALDSASVPCLIGGRPAVFLEHAFYDTGLGASRHR